MAQNEPALCRPVMMEACMPSSLLSDSAAADRCHSFDVLQRISSESSSLGDHPDTLAGPLSWSRPSSWLGALCGCFHLPINHHSSTQDGPRSGVSPRARGKPGRHFASFASFKDADLPTDGARSSPSGATLLPPSPHHRGDHLLCRSSRHSPDWVSPSQRLSHTTSIGSRLASCSFVGERPSALAPESRACSFRQYRYNSCTLPELNEACRSTPFPSILSRDNVEGDLLPEALSTSHVKYLQGALSHQGPTSHQTGPLSAFAMSSRRSERTASCNTAVPYHGPHGAALPGDNSPPGSPMRLCDHRGCSFDMRHATWGAARKCSSQRINRPGALRELRHGISCMLPSGTNTDRERTSVRRLSRLPSERHFTDSPHTPSSPVHGHSPRATPVTCQSSNCSITGAGTGLPNFQLSDLDLNMLLSESSTLHLEGEYPMLVAAQLQPSMHGSGHHRSSSYVVLGHTSETPLHPFKSGGTGDHINSPADVVLNHNMLYLDPAMRRRCEVHHTEAHTFSAVPHSLWQSQRSDSLESAGLAVCSGPELHRRPSINTHAHLSTSLGQERPLLCLRDFQPLHVISKGYAADVHQAYCIVTNCMVILKTYHLQQLDDLAHQHMCREVDILVAAKHVPHMVHLWAAFQEDEHVVLVLEFCSAGDLHGIVKKHGGKLSETHAVCKVLQPLLQALQGLHAQGVAHRDIKLANICYTRQGQLRLCDLGLAINTNVERAKSCGGTEGYMAPELFTDEFTHAAGCPAKTADWLDKLRARLARDQDSHDGTLTSGSKPSAGAGHWQLSAQHSGPAEISTVCALDIWSLGVTAYYILTGQKPFPDSAAFKHAASHGLPLPELGLEELGLPTLVSDFLKVTLHPDPCKRPSASQLLKHPWITTVMSAARSNRTAAPQPGATNTPSSLVYE